MADYQLTATDTIIRTADHAFIPDDPANRDRQTYDKWLTDGGVPDPVPPKIDPELDSVGTSVKTAAQILGAV